MKVRQHFQNLICVNNKALPNLPPFGPDQKLSEDEVLDIMLFGTPCLWQNEMEQQGFDPMEHSLVKVVDFMENIESVEPTPAKPESKKKEKKVNNNDKEGQKPPHCCKTHGANWTHDTKDCRYPNDGNNSNKNKTWSCKAEEDKKKSQKELAAVIAKAVKGRVKKQLASPEKKHKSDSNDEGECFLVESLTGKLDGFNCEQMELLTLEDEVSDEVSA